MSNLHDEPTAADRQRRSDDEAATLIVDYIDRLAAQTRIEFSNTREVKDAFIFGLWWKSFPVYMIGNVNNAYSYDLDNVLAEEREESRRYDFDSSFQPCYKFQFVSDTGSSWHQVYRDLRAKGWERLKVWREGGRLQYLLKIEDEGGKPSGYRRLFLLLDVCISTCRQVQVGTRMQEVPIMQTVCDDLVYIPGE